MHIVIPMAGVGQRFINAGYKEPKPLIKINNKTIIGHACDIFPTETKFTFICNAKHLAETNMREELLQIKPNATVLEIPNHTEGPVYTVLQISDLIKDDEEVIVNYCDFGIYWDYEDFLTHTRERDADGCIVSYKKFHPHMFGSTNYALSTDTEQWMDEIKEKEPIDKEMNKYVSNGTYYFKRGSDLKKYFKELMDKKITYNDEYYVSLVYNLLVKDNLKVSIYDIPHMLQWGIPEDVETYNYWSNYFQILIEEEEKILLEPKSITVISLLDKSINFEKVEYKEYSQVKPLMDVSGKPMLTQVLNSLPKTEEEVFLISKNNLDNNKVRELLSSKYPKATTIEVEDNIDRLELMSGIELNILDKNTSILLTVYDKSIIYDREAYQSAVLDNAKDIIVFTSKNKPFGTFYFRNLEILKSVIAILGENNLLELLEEQYNYNIVTLEVKNLIAWDNSYNYETFTYWQSFFHKVDWHPYSLEKDINVHKNKIKELNNKFNNFVQEYR